MNVAELTGVPHIVRMYDSLYRICVGQWGFMHGVRNYMIVLCRFSLYHVTFMCLIFLITH
jgi:hypothetical protein